jgi:quercetin dioxygenase-like cupin family protein
VSIEKSEILIGPDEGACLPVLDIVHKVTAEVSGGSLKIEEWGLPPGEMIPPHTHAREDECSFVLEGEMKCYVDGEVVLAQKGSYVIKPRGVPHAFYNSGAKDRTGHGDPHARRRVRGLLRRVRGDRITEVERRGAPKCPGRARRALRDNLARREHCRGRNPVWYRFLTRVR